MADMSSWFRSRTPAPRSPARPTSAVEYGDRLQTPLLENDHSREEAMARDRATSRVSSLLSFGKSNTPIMTSTSASADADAAFANITNPDSTWYNPNLEQMVETMITVMMTKESCAQVPTDYNPCILHILEGYRDLRQELKSRNEELAKLKALQDTQIVEFEKLGRDWSQREKDYKSEIKKLEIVLANGPQGLEAVSLARASSVIHGRPSGESITDGIERIKSQSHRGPSDNRRTLNVNFGTDREIELSQMLTLGRMTDARLLATNNQPILLRGSNPRSQRLTDEENLAVLGLGADKGCKSYRRGTVHEEVQDSNIKPGYLNLENKPVLDLKDSKTSRIDGATNEKILPDIPIQIESTETSQEIPFVPHLINRHPQQQQRFSFVSGGDLEKEANRYSRPLATDESLSTPIENYWGFTGRGDPEGSVATVVHDKPSWSRRSPNNTTTIAAKRAIASRSNTK